MPHLETWQQRGPERVTLEGDQLTIGKSRANDLVLRDSLASRLHAVLEKFASGWSIRDLGSSNGTYVNGERITGGRVLHPGDELRVGQTRIVFRSDIDLDELSSSTHVADPAPLVTPREHDVLIELCRPFARGDVLSEPATMQQIASALTLTESSVKKHLIRLYRKFGVLPEPGGPSGRSRLANEAIRRGAVALGEISVPRIAPGS